jgi:hypothetical protein
MLDTSPRRANEVKLQGAKVMVAAQGNRDEVARNDQAGEAVGFYVQPR